MKCFSYFINETLTRTEIKQVEKFADKLFKVVNVDIDLSSKHFFERINDKRNSKQIDDIELMSLFKKTFIKFGKKIGGMNPGLQAVIDDISTDLNIPFLIKYNKKQDELEFIAKTIIRKKDFKTSNQKLRV